MTDHTLKNCTCGQSGCQYCDAGLRYLDFMLGEVQAHPIKEALSVYLSDSTIADDLRKLLVRQ